MSDLIKEMRSFQLYPDHYLRLGADEIERLQARVDADERMVRNCKGAVVLAKEWIAEKDTKIERLQSRVDELESALRGYVKATTGQESATVTFPMAPEGEVK